MDGPKPETIHARTLIRGFAAPHNPADDRGGESAGAFQKLQNGSSILRGTQSKRPPLVCASVSKAF